MDSSGDSLLCNEELPDSPFSSPPPHTTTTITSSTTTTTTLATATERDHAVRVCLQKESSCSPRHGYSGHLRRSARLVAFRCKAVRWIIMARGKLKLSHGTAFSAVNHLDRFVSIFHCKRWESWMMELISIACLSIAAKFEEVSSPSLQAFPMEDLDHSYQPSTIERMELLVLKALDWRLHCVTAYSYVYPLTWHMDTVLHKPIGALTARVIELLLGSLLDIQFSDHRPFTVALSAVRCALEEISPVNSSGTLSDLDHLIPADSKDEMKRCFQSMEDIEWSWYCPLSPVTVIRQMRRPMSDEYFDLDIFFGLNDNSSSKMKRQRR